MTTFHALLARALMAGAMLALPAAYAADTPASAPGLAATPRSTPASAPPSMAEPASAPEPANASGPAASTSSAPASAPHSTATASAPDRTAPQGAATEHGVPTPAVPAHPSAQHAPRKHAAPPKAVTTKKAAPRKKAIHPRKHAAPSRHARKRKTVAAEKAATVASGVSADERQNRNPVLEAIQLVATTQQEEIKAADRKVSESDWWSDTLERNWIVRRPFGPGIFDSTHWFYVSYKVNGRILMSWFVDLNKHSVSAIAPPEQHSQR